MFAKLSTNIALFLFLGTIVSWQGKDEPNLPKGKEIAVSWVKGLAGDFSFVNEWSYPEGVYVNSFGQLSCDGLCPMEIDVMKDSTGRIYDDSLSAFYELVDTTHLYHSMVAQGAMYEWAGSNQIDFKRLPDGSLLGTSMCNATTHTSINIEIKGDSVNAWLEYVSIMDLETYTFPLESGWFKMDKKLLKKGIVKASFHFDFKNELEALVPLDCEGMIYVSLNTD